MKVRISGNSIRLRLKQTEVQHFKNEGTISEVTEFGFDASDKLVFTFFENDRDIFTIEKSATIVAIGVPNSLANEWTNSSMVGFSEVIDTGKGKAIKLLVEKDFACLDGSDRDNEDSYPNPNLTC